MSYDPKDDPWIVVSYPVRPGAGFMLVRRSDTYFRRFTDNGDPFPTKEAAQRKADELNRKLTA